jgi:hypothetical protein
MKPSRFALINATDRDAAAALLGLVLTSHLSFEQALQRLDGRPVDPGLFSEALTLHRQVERHLALALAELTAASKVGCGLADLLEAIVARARTSGGSR